MLTIKRIVLALVAVTLTCLVPTLAFGQDSVLSVEGSGAYNWLLHQCQYGFPRCTNARFKPGFHGRLWIGGPLDRSRWRPVCEYLRVHV